MEGLHPHLKPQNSHSYSAPSNVAPLAVRVETLVFCVGYVVEPGSRQMSLPSQNTKSACDKRITKNQEMLVRYPLTPRENNVEIICIAINILCEEMSCEVALCYVFRDADCSVRHTSSGT